MFPGRRNERHDPAKRIHHPADRLILFWNIVARYHISNIGLILAIELCDILNCSFHAEILHYRLEDGLHFLWSAIIVLQLIGNVLHDIQQSLLYIHIVKKYK